jgi:hypothetical protein
MNNRQSRAGQPTREIASKRNKNRVRFTLLVFVGILVILLVAYHGKSLGLGGIGGAGVWVTARVVANYSDVKTNQMMEEEKGAIPGSK